MSHPVLCVGAEIVIPRHFLACCRKLDNRGGFIKHFGGAKWTAYNTQELCKAICEPGEVICYVRCFEEELFAPGYAEEVKVEVVA